jgi:hypothetical protein
VPSHTAVLSQRYESAPRADANTNRMPEGRIASIDAKARKAKVSARKPAAQTPMTAATT